MDQLLNAGRVGRAHGLDGSFRVTRPRARLLNVGATVQIAGATTEIVRCAGTSESPILRVDAFANREAIVAVRGEDLLVDRSSVPALADDEWLAEDLEGLKVVDGAAQIGVVVRMLAYPSCDLLEVKRPERDDVLVPLIADCVRGVDLAAGTVDVDMAFLGDDQS